MRLIFAGTPEFAQVAMAALHAAGHEVVLVLTQPDRPAGRGMKLQPSPVKQWALDHGVAVAQPRSLRLDGKYPEDAVAARDALQAAKADAMIVAAYGLILPQWVLDLPPKGCLNIHASLLPRWRGAAPIHRAIEAGDTQTGITIMQMDAGLDTGDMLLVLPCAIAPSDTTAVLHDRLAELGGQAIVQALAHLDALPRQVQPSEGVNYAHKIDKSEAAIDWTLSAEVLARRIRAFDPFPGMTVPLAMAAGVETLKLWQAVAEVAEGQAPAGAPPGTVLSADASGVRVACGEGLLCLTQLQRPGGKRLSAADFLRGCPLQPGQRWVA
ncbi:methionyl-tRNA formyltransferase [Limnohabitans sp. Rim28]|uniref:methionyl-tRNA formyltransferase n=1 Tax=Limnohabitans sp. Rim28 TaxID=1100720 RepID=UPI0002F22951|nr:methionyl-tRNA formyltransferase [Limnohabitans sp. Rim28]PVE07307.1 methionyl-tRNA formyltransferase [Limnohabitans sp. Rim28]